MVEHENAFHHGQVVAASWNQVSIRLLGETLPSSANDATPVAPIVAILLEALSFGTSEWSVDEMIELHNEILDRTCGTSTNSGSNDVSTILADLVDPSSFPTVVGTRTWIDPKTGGESSFTLQHAIDYVYYVYGGVQPVPASVGTSFCRPPSSRPRRQLATPASSLRPAPANDQLEIFDPDLDDDDDAISEVSAGQPQLDPPSSRKRAARNTTANRSASKPRVDFQDPGTDTEKDTQIAQLLIDRPGLTERFLQLRSDAAVQGGFADAAASPAREAPVVHSATVPVQHQQEDGGYTQTGSIQQVCHEQQETKYRSKYAFVPSVTQRHIHAQITALRHQGKSVPIFLEVLINAGFVLFKPFPSVLGRAFAIEFGIRGLSIMHFMPFTDLSDKAVWIATSGVNMQNFSAAVPLPAAPVAEGIDDIIDALQSLATYAVEYFSPVLRDLVDSLVTFAKLRLRQMRWDQDDLILLVYWINIVLKSFRIEMETGTSDGSRIKLRCTNDDVDFRQILVHIQQRQIRDLQAALNTPHHKRVST
ncbi:uncharacterized protein IUM83_19701 [Phytophthora cinnamomi]|uniref:uncharacterized protein n=1 Tax=Phytophthora cinnamomi TaxID=4785 RepID=UPI003559BBBB|nr:hypothetical protein IUM83_19701 [Phytophthora cinnamomi]